MAMQKIILAIFFICFLQHSVAQPNKIAKCWLWKAKEGAQQKFESGYHKHFMWHYQNGDNPVWFCWQFQSGPRYGQYLDVSFNNWKDFDKSFKPDEDDADFKLNVEPYAYLQTAFKLSYQENLSFGDSAGLYSKYIRLLTLSVNDFSATRKIIEKLKHTYFSTSACKAFLVYKMIDGGNLNQIFLMLGFDSYSNYGKSENFQEEIAAIEDSLKTKPITAITSETLSLRTDLVTLHK
jgi:hypothetical protein